MAIPFKVRTAPNSGHYKLLIRHLNTNFQAQIRILGIECDKFLWKIEFKNVNYSRLRNLWLFILITTSCA